MDLDRFCLESNPWPALAGSAGLRALAWGSASVALAGAWSPAWGVGPGACNLVLAALFALALWIKLHSRAATRLDAALLLDAAPSPLRWPWAASAHAIAAPDWALVAPLLLPLSGAPESFGPFQSQSCSVAQIIAHAWLGL